MKTCPFCAEKIQDDAIKCRYCGEFLDGRPRVAYPVRYGLGYEYRSKVEILGWPLVHIAHGVDPTTGLPRVAKGVIAVGNIAVGLLALGGVAAGGLVFGGVGVGLCALAGLAVGGIAFGGLAVGVLLAVGGAALSAMYAIGGLAIAPHAVGATGADPELLRLLEPLLPGITDAFLEGR